MWGFKAADADNLKDKQRHVIVIFKEKLTLDELPAEVRTYRKLRVCIQPSSNLQKMAARIR